MNRRGKLASAAVLSTAATGLACRYLIRMSTRWRATAPEIAADLPGDELLPGARTTTYAVTIAAPPEDVWPWLVQIRRGRGGFYTYTGIERLLGADIANLDRIDPSLQELETGDRIWMTPERYLGRLPGQFWQVRQVEPGRALILERKPPESAQRAIWSLTLNRTQGGMPRLLDRHRSERHPWMSGSLADIFWRFGTLLMERGMLRGIRARAERPSQPGRSG